MTHTPTRTRFISLKWQLLILFGAILFLFTAAFPVMVYWTLQQKFELSRKQTERQYQQNLKGELANSHLQIQQLAEIVLLRQHTPKAILQALQHNKSKLELDWHIRYAQLYDRSGRYLGGWGNTLPSSRVRTTMKQVIQQEQAQSLTTCEPECLQYDLIPVLHSSVDEPTVSHVLFLAYDTSQTLINFTQKYGAKVGVLAPMDKPVITDKSIPQWHTVVSALTDYEQILPYLKILAQRYDLPSLLTQHTVIREANLPVEFSFFQLQDNSPVIFFTADWIATQRQEIRTITAKSLGIAVLSFIILGVTLLALAHRPLSRLTQVSRALPLLAQQRYESVRTLLSHKPNTMFHNELDQLENSTLTLTDQLEQLNLSLIKQNQSLQQERDLVTNLIDTAQVIIITLDKECYISSFNDFAQSITGYREQDVLHQPFQSLFPPADWSDMEATLSHLKQHPQAVAQQEARFIHQDGSIRLISWLHSSLAHANDDAVILSVGMDITEQRRNEAHILWIAEHDVLTQLYNRHKFTLEFERILTYSTRFSHQGALLFLDLDQFKDINDSYGHEAGDYILIQVAQFLRRITRETDIVARLGGDEFAIILPETAEDGAITLAGKIATELHQLDLIYHQRHFRISASIGIITFPQAEMTVAELLSNADLAMYEAKAQGKNTWHQFKLTGKSRQQLENRLFWKQKIEEALEKNRFIFHYQPIMDIRSRTVSHYEMLIRMLDKDDHLIPPAHFIEIAEQTGLIHHIDHYVLHKGIEKLAQIEQMRKGISLSINLSAYAIDDQQLLPLIQDLIEKYQVDASHLIIELTETATVADIEQAKTLMQNLGKLGCRFSIDDFGTGFASFHYMRELPVDIVKIDGAFISKLANNPDDQLFVKALVTVADGMGKETVAEFVESKETLALLHPFGVDYAQGYYIGKPQPDVLSGDLQLS